MSGEETASPKPNYREMKQRIDSDGPVNMMALEEFNECEAAASHPDARARRPVAIDRGTPSRPSPSSTSPPKKSLSTPSTPSTRAFSEAFHTIFGGGMAEMRLTEPDSSATRASTSSIASGQAPANVLLLSGGEKAMNRAGAAHCHLPLPTKPLLHPGRSRRAAR